MFTRMDIGPTISANQIEDLTLQVKRTIDLPAHPNSLAVTPDGNVLYVTVKTPHDAEHPAYRIGARDSVVRIDLR